MNGQPKPKMDDGRSRGRCRISFRVNGKLLAGKQGREGRRPRKGGICCCCCECCLLPIEGNGSRTMALGQSWEVRRNWGGEQQQQVHQGLLSFTPRFRWRSRRANSAPPNSSGALSFPSLFFSLCLINKYCFC
jgi:hypothetical protein